MLISGIIILLFISAIAGQNLNGIIINRAAALVLLYLFIISIFTLYVSIIGSGIGVTGDLYQITVLSKIVELVIYLIGGIILANTLEKHIFCLFDVLLATIYIDNQSATSPGLIYFLLGDSSSGLISLNKEKGLKLNNLPKKQIVEKNTTNEDNLSTCISDKPETIVKEFIKTGKPVTAQIINQVLANQGISITQAELDELLNIEPVEIDFADSDEEVESKLTEYTGISQHNGYAGVYIFKDKITGLKYVGSSNLLRRRMEYYKGNSIFGKKVISGKILPIIWGTENGLSRFTVKIYVLDSTMDSKMALLLEQYYLLHEGFDLNTLRVVNAGNRSGLEIYIYNLSLDILYFSAVSTVEVKRVLGIHTQTIKFYKNSCRPYLNKFLIFSYEIDGAEKSNLTATEFKLFMHKYREFSFSKDNGSNTCIKLTIKKNVNDILNKEEKAYDWIILDNVASLLNYFNDNGLNITKTEINSNILSDKWYNNLYKWSYVNKDQVISQIMDNFNSKNVIAKDGNVVTLVNPNSLIDSTPMKIDNRYRSLIVTGPENFYKEFNNITNCLNYFKIIDLKFDRKHLSTVLKHNNLNPDKLKYYKFYLFKYRI